MQEMTLKRHHPDNRSRLYEIAVQAMIDRNLLPAFSGRVRKELEGMNHIPARPGGPFRDLRGPLWCSIDNDDSLDLDQLTTAEDAGGGRIRVMVAVADVDAFVKKGSAVDDHARHNTTSVYTAGGIFPMLPDKLSNDLTSLKFEEDRYAVIIEMVIDGKGKVIGSDVTQAVVRNKAKLAYDDVTAWLKGEGPVPEPVKRVKGMDDCIRLQDRAAQMLRRRRYERGALDFETIQFRPVFDKGTITGLAVERTDRANELIEDLMIAANEASVRFLKMKGFPSLRRVVRKPKNWERIVEIAKERGSRLPPDPDSRALEKFLEKQKAADPVRFPDLSIAVIKLIGRGEYVVESGRKRPAGHFALAVTDYNHSTAPNRRFPDLITQRMLKSALAGSPPPYRQKELEELALRCTEKEDDATKVERRVAKSAAALVLSARIGEMFDAVCTGISDKGTWVRLLDPPVEGKLLRGFGYIDVGDEVRVKLIKVDVEHGFVDLKMISPVR